MTTILTKQAPSRETRNTFNLPTGGAIRRELVQVFRDQRAATLSYLDQSKAWDGLEYKWGLPIAWPSWDSLNLGVSNIVGRLKDLVETIWDKAGSAFLALIGLDPDSFDATDPTIQALIEQDVVNLATEINGTTSDQLRQALDTVGKEVADGTIPADRAEAELTRSIGDIFANAKTSRAGAIGMTEASRAFHAAQEAAAIESGVVSGWQWKCNGDPCDVCLEIQAECQFMQLGGTFAIVGDNPTYQEILYPPAHPRCMCSLEPIIISDTQPDWGTTLIQPTGKKGYAPEPAELRVKAFPVPKRFPRRGRLPLF